MILSPSEDNMIDMELANLLKHKIRFSLIDQTSNPIDSGSHYKGYHYRSDVIDHGKNIGANHTNEVHTKITPLLYYMLSTMRRDTEELFLTNLCLGNAHYGGWIIV